MSLEELSPEESIDAFMFHWFTREPYRVERLSEEGVKQLAREFLDRKWIMVTNELMQQHGVMGFMVNSVLLKYNILDDAYILWDTQKTGHFTIVHVDDYNKAVELYQKAREVLA